MSSGSKMNPTNLDDTPMFRSQLQCLEETADLFRERCLKFYKGCHKYTEGLGEAYDRDIAFLSALEMFGGGNNDPMGVSFGGPFMAKFTIALREIATCKEVLRSQVENLLSAKLLQFVNVDLHDVKEARKRYDKANVTYEQAGLPTRMHQWWEGIPFVTSAVVIVCSIIYFVCLVIGYDSFVDVCFLPMAIVSDLQAYRVYTAIFFHASMLHVLFNMLALVPLGSELERIMGSVRLFYMIVLLATANAILNLAIALLLAHNPAYRYPYFMNECAIGFSGVLFSMIVMETSLSGVHSRSVFGLFNVPAKWYPWILLVVFQLLMTNVSLLGHLCGILSGFAYTYGLFNFIMPGASFFSSIESSSLLSTFVRRPKFILCSGGGTSGYIPTYAAQNTTSSGVTTGNVWNHLSSWMSQRDTASQSEEDRRFPGRGRTLSAARNDSLPAPPSDSSLQARLLDNRPDPPSGDATVNNGSGRQSPLSDTAAERTVVRSPGQNSVASDEDIQKLVAMGFEKTQVEVAVAAADGDLDIAVEILMSQQG